MDGKILVLDFSGLRGEKRFAGSVYMDFRNLAGTDGYCSEEAASILRREIRQEGYGGIHFLDSGNYHYLTKFFLEQIREPFQLAVFDHHTDMQPPALLPLLSCGSWLLDTLKENRFLKKVYLAGPPKERIRECAFLPEAGSGRLICVSEEELEHLDSREFPGWQQQLPLYISIDTDVLGREDARTNWDQGNLKLEKLCRILQAAGRGVKILGADICGGIPPQKLREEWEETEKINSRTDSRLLMCIQKMKKQEDTRNGI